MSFRVIFRPTAREQAIEAANYILAQGYPEAAARWYEALEAAIASLAEMPRRYPFARENEAFEGVELRQVVFYSHRLIYTVVGDTVEVLHVRHASRRDIESL